MEDDAKVMGSCGGEFARGVSPDPLSGPLRHKGFTLAGDEWIDQLVWLNKELNGDH